MQSDDVSPTPSSLTFGFHVIDPWRQSGNFPVVRANLKMTTIPRIQLISCLELFMKLYFMDYIKYEVIPETNKCLNSPMNLSEYFSVIFCRLIMACYVGHSGRGFFLRYSIKPQKGAPIYPNHTLSRRRLEKITQVLFYKILLFLISIIPFSGRGIRSRFGTRTWQHILTHHGSVFLMSQSRSGLTTTLALGVCLSPAILTFLGEIITQFRVLNIRLFIMLTSWRGRINP